LSEPEAKEAEEKEAKNRRDEHCRILYRLAHDFTLSSGDRMDRHGRGNADDAFILTASDQMYYDEANAGYFSQFAAFALHREYLVVDLRHLHRLMAVDRSQYRDDCSRWYHSIHEIAPRLRLISNQASPVMSIPEYV
jgi:hypothetical protein